MRLTSIALLFLLLFSSQLVQAQTNAPTIKKIFTFKIDKDIDPAMNRRVELALNKGPQNVGKTAQEFKDITKYL